MDVQPPPSDAELLTDPGQRLVEHAREATETAFDPEHFHGAHMVGAAVRTTDGDVFTGVSQPAGVGRASVCAEPSALSAARIAGADGFAASAAVRHPLPDEDREFEVVSACGVCRELLCDYDESCAVIFPTTDGPRKAPVESLLPTRHW
ncbi:cytidine deaminase [Halococcus sp. PRR34]|uniref:cytidine deaminase n=1 Tax=Halococcus sp. PRR34 TaxID=3020830 RepID=UPI0023619F7E|nr:cytidine deaminase [Halococcus sp. PRR34]